MGGPKLVCSALSSGFDFVEFTVKKKKTINDSIEGILSLIHSYLLFVSFHSMPKPICGVLKVPRNFVFFFFSFTGKMHLLFT